MSTTVSPAPQQPVPLLNIANVLTVLRIVLVPVFVAYAVAGQPRDMLIATIIFMVAAATDKLDGDLARSRGLITNFGKIADPIADKALTMSALIVLSATGRLWWWVTVVIIVRELGITLMRMLMLRRAVMAASRGGKLKTMLQMMGLVGLLMPWQMFVPAGVSHALEQASYAIIGAALVVTVVTGVDYVLTAMRLSREGAPRQ